MLALNFFLSENINMRSFIIDVKIFNKILGWSLHNLIMEKKLYLIY